MRTCSIIIQVLFTSVVSAAFYVQSAAIHSHNKMSHNDKGDGAKSEEAVHADNEELPELPQLPMADPDDESIPTLKFGETLRFEDLGPIIINSDGTTRRIENWNELSDKEKEVSWRRISKRNEERRNALLMAAEATSIEASENHYNESMSSSK